MNACVFRTCALILLAAPTLFGMQRQSSEHTEPRRIFILPTTSSSFAEEVRLSIQRFATHQQPIVVLPGLKKRNHEHVILEDQEYTMFFNNDYPIGYIRFPLTRFRDEQTNRLYRLAIQDEELILIPVDQTTHFTEVLPITLHSGHICKRPDTSIAR